MTRKTLCVVGATSGIAEECIRQWIAKGSIERIILIARSEEKLNRIMNDLRVRAPGIEFIACAFNDFNDPVAIGSLVAKLTEQQAVDIALIAHGTLPEQLQCQVDLSVANEAMMINGISPMLFAESLCGHMENQGKGTLVVIGSVAGDRGRKSNYTYGAAKGLVNRYVQGLQHRLAGSSIKVVLVKPGPTATPMTEHLVDAMKMASVESVAKAIFEGSEKGKPVIYAPAKWALIMLIIRHLPRFIFNKMDI